MNKTKARERGDELLRSVEASVPEVSSLAFPIHNFRDVAKVRAWARNHGFPKDANVVSMRKSFVLAARAQDDFEDGTLRDEPVGKSGVVATVGTLKAHLLEEDPEPPVDAPAPEDTGEAPESVPFARTGEVVRCRKAAGDPEASVRMFGIVMKPEVPDVEGDVTAREEIERANLEFMKDFGTVGFMHKKDVSDRVKIVQNVIAPIDFEFPLPDGTAKAIAAGTWYQELYSEDEEIVQRVRADQITGLSIGGFARRVPVTEMSGGELRLSVPESYAPAFKRAIEDAVSKAEGDPALARFVDLRVEEVSLVDAAANEEVFFIVKRRKEMSKSEPAAVTPAPTPTPDPPVEQVPAPVTVEEPTPEPAPEDELEPVTKTIEDQIAAGIAAGIQAGLAAAQASAPAEPAPEPAPAPEEPNDLTSILERLNARLDVIEQNQQTQGSKLDDVARARAVAKGSSVPDDTAAPAPDAPERPVSKWAGTAVSAAVEKSKTRR